ncbi:MAG: hypothetical protein HQ582_07955, partial [Planctomycetes bacterium]|nr:hypothetical protein [Planctomycetota bacterium]
MTNRDIALVMILLGCSVATAAGVETVRVDSSAGAPRLLVDGKPVRARMFWGAPGSGLIPVGPQGERITFEFSPSEDELSRATMHFRFGATPGTVCLDDVHVVEIDAGQDVVPRQQYEQGIDDFNRHWTIWPPGPQNTVGAVEVKPGCGRDQSGGLEVDLKAPKDGRWPDFHIHHHATLGLRKGRRYRVSLWARAEPARNLTIAFYRPGQAYVFLGGPPGPFEQQIKLAADVGVDFVSFPVSLPWPQPGQSVDWSGVEAQCRRVLDA